MLNKNFQRAKLPNILFIIVDCGRSDKWINNNRTPFTPNLDRLRQESVTFPTTISEKSVTTPSFVTFLSGLYSTGHNIHQVWGYKLNEKIPLMTHFLAEQGYQTYAEVSGPLIKEMGLARGFHRYEYRAPCDYLHTKWGDFFIERLKKGYYRPPWFLLLHLWELHTPRQIVSFKNHPSYGRDAYERAVSSLDEQLGRVFRASGKETAIIFTGDHGEKTKSEVYQEGTAVGYTRKMLGLDKAQGLALYQISSWAGPSFLQQLYAESIIPSLKQINLGHKWKRPKFSLLSTFRDRLRIMGLAPKLSCKDLLSIKSPLKLTDMLKRRGFLDEKTARDKVQRFLESSNHANLIEMQTRMLLNSYKKNLKEGHVIHVYDYLVKVPLVIRWPGRLPAGITVNRMIRLPDIFPTVLDLIGLKTDTRIKIDGLSFRPLISGAPWESSPAYLSVSGLLSELELRGVRTERYKYTYGPHNPDLPQELYDLSCDPQEKNNIAGEKPRKCQYLRDLADSFSAECRSYAHEEMKFDIGQKQNIETRLRELGYLD